MTATDLETYNGQLARLSRDRIMLAAQAVAAELADRWSTRPVAVDYQPGNGTAYHLVFVPMRSVAQLSGNTVPAGLRDHTGFVRPGWTLVAKCNCTDSDWVYPFDLSPGNRAHVGYVADKTGSNIADATAITALFRAICGVPLEDG